MPPARVRAHAPNHNLTGADVCGIAVSCGFVFGVLLTLVWYSCIEWCAKKRRMY